MSLKMPKKNKSKSLSYVKKEAEDLFDAFCSSGGQDKKNGIGSRGLVSDNENIEGRKKRISLKIIGEKFRQPFKKLKSKKKKADVLLNSTERPKNCSDGATKSSDIVHERVIVDKMLLEDPHFILRCMSKSESLAEESQNRLTRTRTTVKGLLGSQVEYQSPKFPPTIFPPPPPPPPPPSYTSSSYIEFDGDESDIESPSSDRMAVTVAESDGDEMDGAAFEEVSEEERQKRIKEVAKGLDKIADEFSTDLMQRSSYTSSLAGLAQTLSKNLSYSNFKTILNKEITRSNDKLLNQIAFAFSVVRSAIDQVGPGTQEAEAIQTNLIEYYTEEFGTEIARRGGIGAIAEEN